MPGSLLLEKLDLVPLRLLAVAPVGFELFVFGSLVKLNALGLRVKSDNHTQHAFCSLGTDTILPLFFRAAAALKIGSPRESQLSSAN